MTQGGGSPNDYECSCCGGRVSWNGKDWQCRACGWADPEPETRKVDGVESPRSGWAGMIECSKKWNHNHQGGATLHQCTREKGHKGDCRCWCGNRISVE